MGNKRFLAGILAAALAVSIMGKGECPAYAQEAPDEKQYVIITEDETVYDQVADEVGDSIVVETPILSENNVIVATLTETEAEALSKEDDVWIEEDILLAGSASEADARRAWRAEQKAEKIRRAEEYLAMEEEEDAEEEPEYEWNLQAVNADAVIPEEEEDRQTVKVAVLDSGVDYVSGINLKGYANLVEEEQDLPEMFMDMTGHGTGIAGVIAGNGETGIYGVNPNAEVYSVKVLDGENKAPLSRIIRGIYWCVENDINIINMSFGTPVYSKALEQAVADAYANNILMVAAAGNDGDGVEYPAAFDEVMAVAATDTQARISDFSNTGEELEIAAPGEKIRVTGFFDGSQVTHGTSIAVPHVTGAASLLWEKDLTKSNAFIRELLSQSAKDIEGTDECGLLDVEYALASYDEFAANYNEEDETRTVIPKNLEDPESFEDVDLDEAYVEGRWRADSTTDTAGNPVKGHKDMVDTYTTGFSTNAVNIVKKGITFPDTEDVGWHVMKSNDKKDRNNWWHGKLSFTENGIQTEINYVGVFEMVSNVAIEGMDWLDNTSSTAIDGLNKTVFNKVKADLKKLNFDSIKTEHITYKISEEDRKYFLYGCAMHEMTDAFSHVTTTPDGTLIRHIDSKTDPKTMDPHDADNSNYYYTRYNVAAKAVAYSMQSLQKGWFGDGEEILKAFKDIYKDTTKFKMVKIKPYMNANGYSGAVLTKANIDSYK